MVSAMVGMRSSEGEPMAIPRSRTRFARIPIASKTALIAINLKYVDMVQNFCSWDICQAGSEIAIPVASVLPAGMRTLQPSTKAQMLKADARGAKHAAESGNTVTAYQRCAGS